MGKWGHESLADAGDATDGRDSRIRLGDNEYTSAFWDAARLGTAPLSFPHSLLHGVQIAR